MSQTPSPLPSPCHNNTNTVFKIRRSPLSLFFPSFNRSTASTTSTDKSPTSPSPLTTAPGRRAKFRNANSMDTTRSDEEGKPKKNGYRALLTPEPFGKITLPSTVSFSSSENIRNGATKVPNENTKPSKSVSFHDLIVYPAAIHQAIQSLSSPRKSICQKMTSLSINSNLNLAAASGSAETPKIKRSFSNYYIRFQEEKAMQSAPTAPIDATKFVAYVTERRKKRILFKGEYLMILRSVDPLKCQWNVASSQGDKNQYADTLPYDHSRVVLSKKPTDENSHYINASYVPSWLREKSYVVTQAVKSKAATNEFWRMIWELRANTIVMLTKVFDFMRVMCLQYWPVTVFTYGEIIVETLETKTYAHFVVRTFKLKHANSEEERIVKHFHFTEWELNSFPYISAFIELRRRVRQWTDKNPTDAPIVVHCSNGAGRSGAFCALDANLELLKRTGQIDVFEYAKKMINSRPNLVDSVEQYIFIYEMLSEAVLCNVQPIAMYQLKNRSGMYRSKGNRQLMEIQDSHENKLLYMLTPVLRIGDCAGGHRMENRGKNRDVMVVPPDHARPYLQTLHGESKDYTYINAVEVDGYTRKAEFIVTEWPKQHTIDSFWTLIFDHSCHTVVNLTNQQNTKMYPQFIHNKGKQNYGPFVVEVLNYQQYPAMTSHMVKIQKRTFMISEIMATGATQQQLEAEVRICCIIQVRMWPIENKVPLSTSGLIELIKMTRSWRKRAPDRPETKPTIVMSHNGYSRCGIFIAANVCIDQMDMDHEVDVFHAVKMIRINRPQLIDMKDEYKYLYDLMLHWYMTNPDYRVYDVENSPVRETSEEPEALEEGTGAESLGNGSLIPSNRPSIRSRRDSTKKGQTVYLN